MMKKKMLSLALAVTVVASSFVPTMAYGAPSRDYYYGGGGGASVGGGTGGATTGGMEKKDDKKTPEKKEEKKEEKAPEMKEEKTPETKETVKEEKPEVTETEKKEETKPVVKKTVTVSTKAVNDALKKAKKGNVVFRGNESTKLDAKVVKALAAKANSVKVTTKKASVTLDKAALASIGNKAVTLSVKTGKKSFEVSLKNGKKMVKNFKGKVMVRVKLTIKKGQKLFMGKKEIQYKNVKNGFVEFTLTSLGKVTVK